MTTLTPIDTLRERIAELNADRYRFRQQGPGGWYDTLADESEWLTSQVTDDAKPYMVRFPERYDTAELRAALHARQPSAAAAWAARCGSCGGRQVPGTRCVGAEGPCGEGEGGGPAECCGEWGNRCCACGWAYGVSQL